MSALSELAEEYCAAKSVTARSTSGNSNKARRSDLALWGRVLSELRGETYSEEPLELSVDLAPHRVSDLSSERMIRVIEILRTRYSPATVQRQLSSIRGFCKWLTALGFIDSNPFDDDILNTRFSSEQTVRAFSADDVKDMIEAAGEPEKRLRSAWAVRDQTIIDLIASTGVRNGECVALQINDIAGADRPVLHIRRGTKSGKRREVPIPKRTHARIESWLQERSERGLSAKPNDALFVRNNGREFNTDALYHLVRRVALSAGASLPEDALVHGLRHHFGLQLAMRGLPPATLQQLMGHSDPRTTAIYTRHASYDLINALDDAGWL